MPGLEVPVEGRGSPRYSGGTVGEIGCCGGDDGGGMAVLPCIEFRPLLVLQTLTYVSTPLSAQAVTTKVAAGSVTDSQDASPSQIRE